MFSPVSDHDSYDEDGYGDRGDDHTAYYFHNDISSLAAKVRSIHMDDDSRENIFDTKGSTNILPLANHLDKKLLRSWTRSDCRSRSVWNLDLAEC